MIFDLLAPFPGPQGAGPKKCAIAHTIYVSNSHTKFGSTSSNGLGGDGVTDGWTDGRMEAIAVSLTLFKKNVGIKIGAFALFSIIFSNTKYFKGVTMEQKVNM